MAAFDPPFRLYRRQETILPGGNMKSVLLLIVSVASIPAQAATIGITYSDSGNLTGPPVVSGTSLILDGLATGSFLTANPALNTLWNPFTIRDHNVVNLMNGLSNGTFTITFADGDMLSGNLAEDVSAVLPTQTGPFTQILTFTGGTGMFAGASGSTSGRGVTTTTGFTASGSGTLTAPGILTPEPASAALIFGGLLAIAGGKFGYGRKQRCNDK